MPHQCPRDERDVIQPQLVGLTGRDNTAKHDDEISRRGHRVTVSEAIAVRRWVAVWRGNKGVGNRGVRENGRHGGRRGKLLD